MTSISLRGYNREIESLIENDQIEEAIAHCRHILELYPKHVATYRLLGKAYLEAQRYEDAEDVLQRVLACVPDDFIAHVGMSIIREASGNQDEAIWHMERAFDVQPSNAAIQAELRRLYGQRDGTPPAKVTLTRGALARMSARSHLYSQAIGELRSILAEEPQRPDLQVVLARLYFQTGQRNTAIETCSALLNRLPNCLEANRIMAEALPSTERASEAPYYQQRVESIDPYSAHISMSYPSSEQVPDEEVTVERLVFGLTAALRPDRADRFSTGESLPQSADREEETAEQTPAEEQASQGETQATVEEIPEWMRAAGWVAATQDSSETESQPLAEESAGSEAGDIPDWLRSLAPESQPVEAQVAGTPEDDELPEWLAVGAAAVGIGTTAALAGKEGDETLTGEVATIETVEEVSETLGEPVSAAGMESAEIEAVGQPEEGVSLPDWLAGAGAAAVAAGVLAAGSQEDPGNEVGAASLESAAEALVDENLDVVEAARIEAVVLEAGAAEALGQEISVTDGEIPGTTLDESFLEDAVVSETVIEETAAADEHAAETAAAETAVAETAAAETAVEEADGVTVVEGKLAAEPAIEEEKDGVPAWLAALSPTSEAPALDSTQDQPQIETPLPAEAASLAFLAGLALEAGEQDSAIVEPDQGEQSMPVEIEIVTPDWLKELAGEEQVPAARSGPAFSDVEEVEEIAPDWLQDLSGEPPAEVMATAGEIEPQLELEPSLEEGVPDWLKTAMAASEAVVSSEVMEDRPAALDLIEPAVIEGDTRPVQVHPVQDAVPTVPGEVTGENVAPESAWLESPIAGEAVEIEAVKTIGEEAVQEYPETEELSPAGWGEEPEEQEDLPWLGVAGAAALGAVINEPGEQPEEVAAVSIEGAEEVSETVTTGSLAEILTAAGAVYPAEEPARAETKEDEMAAEPELPETETFTEISTNAEGYEWIEEPAASGELPASIEEILVPSERMPEDLPDWLREYETIQPTPAADVEETEWFATAAATGFLDATKLSKRESEGLLDLNAASQAQLERMPGVGFILAQSIVAYREQHGPFTDLNQLEDVPGMSPVALEALHERLTLAIVPEEPPLSAEVPDLAQAWQSLSDGDIEGAAARYSDLIKQGQPANEVIREIQQALALHPSEPALYQALGDALMRADRLQEALEAYDRAEDLLR